MLRFFAILLAVFVALILLVFFGRTWQLEHSSQERDFQSGDMPSPLPSGFYSGTVSGPHFLWIGKTFDYENATGFNAFNNNSTGVPDYKFPFVTYSGEDIRDPSHEVFKIDYNVPQNPFWLRPLLDEIVQVAPDQFLGKMQLRLIPGIPFTLTFFELSKSTGS